MKYNVEPISLKEIEDYIKDIYKNQTSKKDLVSFSIIEINHNTEEGTFAAGLKSNGVNIMTGLGGLVNNPVPRTMWQSIYYNGNKIPDDKLEDFWKFCDELYKEL